jgi:predicted amidohydrolase YtcJ
MEETPDPDGRIHGCTEEVAPGLPHCRAHATQRLGLTRQFASQVRAAMVERSGTLLDLQLELASLTNKHENDRRSLIDCYRAIENYAEHGITEDP